MLGTLAAAAGCLSASASFFAMRKLGKAEPAMVTGIWFHSTTMVRPGGGGPGGSTLMVGKVRGNLFR